MPLPASRAFLLLLLLPACPGAGGDGAPDGSASTATASASVEGPAEASPADAASSAPAAPALPATTPGVCLPGMLEVKGSYCTGLMQRCVKGGRTYVGKPDTAPMPYFCDEYQVGYAKCLGREVPKHFCMDDLEYPNVAGELPRVMVTWYEAKALCEGQGKRLCGDDEWTLACEGPERRPFAYGWSRDATACNIDRPWIKPDDGILASTNTEKIATEIDRLSQRVGAGTMPGCVSPYGIHDLGGNVDEWTVNVTLGAKPYRSMFKGGHWAKGARNRCRPTTEIHDESTAYYAEGFRCCADVRK
ncbi:MAG: hypothetical protein EOO75_12510 [Myxococcales bacterium]|nr:MAG: hypothetical protein EOO75_12510 [Myxococcales bacterium]